MVTLHVEESDGSKLVWLLTSLVNIPCLLEFAFLDRLVDSFELSQARTYLAVKIVQRLKD